MATRKRPAFYIPGHLAPLRLGLAAARDHAIGTATHQQRRFDLAPGFAGLTVVLKIDTWARAIVFAEGMDGARQLRAAQVFRVGSRAERMRMISACRHG